MLEPIVKFADFARSAGLRISSSEVLDCISHLELIDILDEPTFQATLKTNFAKSRREQGKFDRLYRLFFIELRSDIEIIQGGSLIEEIADVLPGEEAAVIEPGLVAQAFKDGGGGCEEGRFTGSDPADVHPRVGYACQNGRQRGHGAAACGPAC